MSRHLRQTVVAWFYVEDWHETNAGRDAALG